MEMRGLPPSSSPALAGTVSTPLAEMLQSQSAKGSQPLDSVKMLTDLAQVASLLKTQNTAGISGTAGISNSAGAPAIGDVQINFSPEDLAAALLVLQGKTQEAQLTTAREGLTISKTKLDEKNQQAMDKINGWVKKSEEAKGADIAGKVFGLLAKAAGFIASVAALTMAIIVTAVSSGAGAPLIALAAVSLVSSSISLVSQISQTAGGPPLELSSILSKAMGAILEGIGVPKETADSLSKIGSGVLGMVSGAVLVDPAFVGQAYGGFAQLVGGDPMQVAIVSGVFTAVAAVGVSIIMIAASGGTDVGAVVNGIAKTVMTVGAVGQSVIGIASGLATAAQGGITIAKSSLEFQGDMLQADKKLVDSVILKLQKQMEDDREAIKKVMQEMMDGISTVSQMINAGAVSQMQISSNIAGQRQAI